MSNDLDDFGDRLLWACKHAGVAYSQSAIGYLIDENKQSVENWMKGSVPRPHTLFKLADALGVDHVWLATGKGTPPSSPRPDRPATPSPHAPRGNEGARVVHQPRGKYAVRKTRFHKKRTA